jgi:hypothetical protein
LERFTAAKALLDMRVLSVFGMLPLSVKMAQVMRARAQEEPEAFAGSAEAA